MDSPQAFPGRVIFDHLPKTARQAINARIPIAQAVEAELDIDAPAQPGRYLLQVLLVQEMYCWFNEIGFTPAEVWVDVVETDDASATARGSAQENAA
ncbi:MAG: hypothetical protein KatS3mg122_3316 [Caldimonas sp.]|nr:MAG: hypothetical protein KatS3mg122_3316 [Caldimonas sp.]